MFLNGQTLRAAADDGSRPQGDIRPRRIEFPKAVIPAERVALSASWDTHQPQSQSANARGLGMTLEQIFFLSQSIAGFALVVSLLFVGLEVRLSNRESAHRTIEEMLADNRELRFKISATAESANCWLQGLHQFSALSPVDKVRFSMLAHCFFQTQQSFFLHHHHGRMTDHMYEPLEKSLSDLVAYPGLQSAWDIRKAYFEGAFRALVDGKIAAAQKGTVVPGLYHEESALV